MEPKKSSRKRTRSFKVHIQSVYLKNILDAVTNHLLIINQVRSFREQPKPERMREMLDPAYMVIAMTIASHEKRPVDKDSLHALVVENFAAGGYVRVSVIEKTNKQPYRITFCAEDFKTIFTRSCTAPVRDASIPVNELAIRALV